MTMPAHYNINDSLIDYVMGCFRWYRKMRGGLWWYSSLTYRWWRLRSESEELIEDYRA